MKKTLLMMSVIGAMGFAGAATAANDASNVFTWSGSVPTSSTQNGFIIKDSNMSDIKNGTLVFSANAAGKGELLTASALDFNVFQYTSGSVGDPVTKYTYQLTNLGATKGGLVHEQYANGYYKITADGVDIVKGTPVVDKSGQTVLTVAPTATTDAYNQPLVGEDIAVQATIVVTNASM